MKKLKILLLSDFSALSMVALKYAARISHTIEVEYLILNVVRLDGIPKTNMRLRAIEKSMFDAVEQEGELLVAELEKQSKAGSSISFKAIRSHTVADAVKRFVTKNPFDLVIMGTQGASSLKKLRLGGTAVSVIEICPAPVMAIPKWASFKNFGTVVYASDLKNVKKELDTIIPFARIFDSTVHMVHVVESMNKQVEAKKNEIQKTIQQCGYPKIDFTVLLDDDIPEAIDGFIKSTKADLLTTFTHELTIYEKLFGLSVTRTLAYQGNIPLVAFKRKTVPSVVKIK